MPHHAKARPRPGPSRNWCDRTAIWQASIAAPLTPWRARAAISAGADPASPQAREATPNRPMPPIKSRLRPKRSAMAPAAIRLAVMAMV